MPHRSCDACIGIEGGAWPTLRALQWLLQSLRMFRHAPLRFYLLPWLPIALEAAIQTVPVIGVVLTKLLVPLCSAWVLWMGDHKLRTGRYRSVFAG